MKDNKDIKFIEKFRSIDFSPESKNMEKNLEYLKNNINNLENEREIIVNKKIKKPLAIIAVAAAVVCITVGAYGQELLRIVRTFTIGDYAKYNVLEDNREFIPVPEELQGLLFDASGNEMKKIEGGQFFNKDGVEVIPIYDNGEFILKTKEAVEASQKSNSLFLTNFEEAKGYFVCDILTPTYLPEGYKFEKAEFYGGTTLEEIFADEEANKYMNIYYSNGTSQIRTMLRFMDEHTAFEGSVKEDVQILKIKGQDAVVSEKILDIQIDDVMYMLFGNDDVGSDELIKIAESLK